MMARECRICCKELPAPELDEVQFPNSLWALADSRQVFLDPCKKISRDAEKTGTVPRAAPILNSGFAVDA
jgi:hypothetical protein